MHIVHVVESFAAGTFRVLQVVVNRQVADGHRLTLIHSLRDETPSDWRQQFDARINCMYFPMRRRLAPCADVLALLRLIVALRRLSPDIVHLHSSKAGAIGRLACLGLRRPRWFFSPHGLSFLQSASAGQVHRPYLLLERLLARAPATIIACSPSEAAIVARYLQRVALVACNGIDIDAVPLAQPVTGRPLAIGSAGRLTVAQKNFEFFAALASRLAGRGLQFVWLGGGDIDDELRLHEAGVKVTGWLEHRTLLQQMAQLDIYVQTSRWEGLPIAVLEAMAAGLAVLVTDVVGNRDAVSHDRTGLVAAEGPEFQQQLERLISDGALRSRLGAAAQREAKTRFSIDSMMDSLYRAYGL